MKTLLLSACLLFGGVSEAAETKSDTIIINVGANKKVVVYGETKADLKDLEKIDLNKALKEMNKNLEEMPVKTRKMVVRDYDGSAYKLDNIDSSLTKWQRFYKKVDLNVMVGSGQNGWSNSIKYSETNKGLNDYMDKNYGKFTGTFSAGFSFLHSSNFRLNNRFRFVIKKGIQYDHITVVRTPSLFINDFKNQDINSLNQLFEDYNQGKTNINTAILSANTNIGMLSFQLKQAIILLNKKGNESFQIGAGFYVGALPINRRRSIGIEKEKSTLTKGFISPQVGINISVGYKIFHLFFQDAIFTQVRYSTLNQSVITSLKYNSSLTTFGLRIGR